MTAAAAKKTTRRPSEKKVLRVGFIGNPNCGKTTLFNAYTGANLKVANWPGVTVEKVEGSMEFQGWQIHLWICPAPTASPPTPWRNRFPGSTSSAMRWT